MCDSVYPVVPFHYVPYSAIQFLSLTVLLMVEFFGQVGNEFAEIIYHSREA